MSILLVISYDHIHNYPDPSQIPSANINATMPRSIHLTLKRLIASSSISIIRPKPNYSLAIRTWSWGPECSYSRMLTTQRMQSPAFMSPKAWLILSNGWRWVMNSSTLRSPFM